MMLMNGPFLNPVSKSYESFTVTQGTETKFLTIQWVIEPNILGPLAIQHSSNFFFTILWFYIGKTYRFRISNVGIAWSFNFRIQNHRMVVVETEGSYTNQITLDSLDVHVGQSYSVLVTADQITADYFIVASPKMSNATEISGLVGIGVLHYGNSTTPPTGPHPFDLEFSINQANSIR